MSIVFVLIVLSQQRNDAQMPVAMLALYVMHGHIVYDIVLGSCFRNWLIAWRPTTEEFKSCVLVRFAICIHIYKVDVRNTIAGSVYYVDVCVCEFIRNICASAMAL